MTDGQISAEIEAAAKMATFAEQCCGELGLQPRDAFGLTCMVAGMIAGKYSDWKTPDEAWRTTNEVTGELFALGFRLGLKKRGSPMRYHIADLSTDVAMFICYRNGIELCRASGLTRHEAMKALRQSLRIKGRQLSK